MYSLTIIFSSISVIVALMTDRAVSMPFGLALPQVSTRKSIAILMAILLWMLSFVVIFSKIGVVGAVLSSVVLWMLLASLIILFEPMKRLFPSYIFMLGILFFILENLL